MEIKMDLNKLFKEALEEGRSKDVFVKIDGEDYGMYSDQSVTVDKLIYNIKDYIAELIKPNSRISSILLTTDESNASVYDD